MKRRAEDEEDLYQRGATSDDDDGEEDDEDEDGGGAGGSGASSGGPRTIFLTGTVSERVITGVVKRIFSCVERDVRKPITLIINTGGGNVDDALCLYDVMKLSPAPIHTIGLGKIMSAGCLLLAAGAKRQRYMGRHARLMYHAGYEVLGGTVLEHENNLAEFQRIERLYDELFAKETGRTLKQVEALYKTKRLDRYLTSEQCQKFGVVDKIV